MKFFGSLLKRLTRSREEEKEIVTEPREQEAIVAVITPPKEKLEEEEIEAQSLPNNIEILPKNPIVKPEKKKVSTALTKISFDPRDIMETMEFPFLALSKNRTKPIIYESPNGNVKIKVSAHREHFVASIYDWDIILFIASKLQEIMNFGSDIPPRTLIIPRHELLKAIHKHSGKTTEKEVEASLMRLKTTLIETTIRNEKEEYDNVTWINHWGYTKRKDIKEFRITPSDWVYDGICKNGNSLLKISPEYFEITSGLKKFLYRTARKHVGNQDKPLDFLIETLHEKSGSEQEFRFFKRDLKKAVENNDLPTYFMKWIEKNEKTYVRFSRKKKEMADMLSDDKET